MSAAAVPRACLAAALLVAGGCSPRAPAPATGTRVVCLAPSLTEMVCALDGGDLLVGRTTACDYPPDIVREIPIVGGFGTPSLETLIATAPTVILDVDLEDETMARRMKDLGLNRERIACRTVTDIPEALARVGAAIGRAERGEQAARLLREQLRAARQSAESVTNRPSVYVEIWHDPLMTAGRRSFLSELVRLAGGRNLGDEVDADYFAASSEWVIDRNPDVIICAYMSNSGSARRAVERRAAWNTITAVREGAIHDDLNNNLVLRPGPRVMQGIAEIRERILPGGSGGTRAAPPDQPQQAEEE